MAIPVLLVDDDAALLQTLQGIFLVRKFDVHVASSTQAAIDKLSERRFDLVVTDMRMETPLSGYDVIRAAKAQAQRPVTVILSAFPIPADEWKQAGADALVLKGTRGALRKLDEVIEMVQHRSRKQAQGLPDDPEHKEKAG
jgi:CheY-like chemotaxis protein